MAVEGFAKRVCLPDPFADKVHRVLGRLFTGEIGNVRLFQLLRDILAGDAVIFEPKVTASAVFVL